MYQCSSCGNPYGSCGHRSPGFRRDAANTYRQLTYDPQFGRWQAAIWGTVFTFAGICWVISAIPAKDWPVIGIGAGILAVIIVLVVIMNKMTDPNRRIKGWQ